MPAGFIRAACLGALALSSLPVIAADPAPPAGPEHPHGLLQLAVYQPTLAEAPPATPQTPQVPPKAPTVPKEPAPAPKEPAPAPPATTPTQDVAREPTLAPGQFGGDTGGQTAALAAPNIQGDLLNAFRSVSFFVSRASGDVLVQGTGSTNVINAKVADNNSPEPRDRVYYRYNFFSNSLSVSGIGSAQTFSPTFSNSIAPLTTKNYDVNLHTFGLEKTFWDKLFSIEVRVPLQTTLSSNLNLNYGTVTGITPATFRNGIPIPNGPLQGLPNPIGSAAEGNFGPGDMGMAGNAFMVTSTPSQTLGSESTELGDLQLIFKSILYRNCNCTLSGGVSMTIPTGQDERVQVISYAADPLLKFATFQGVQRFLIRDENWGLSPFFAFLLKPNDRWFIQGFLETDFPTNGNGVEYSQTLIPAPNPPSLFNPTLPGFARTLGDQSLIAASQRAGLIGPVSQATFLPPAGPVTTRYHDQILGEIDLNTGYWVVRNPQANWLTGLAATAELHYTATLDHAEVITLSPPNLRLVQTGPNPGDFLFATAPAAKVGNFRSSRNILNATLGSTFEFSDRATLSTGIALPLIGGPNRTFDWELLVQLNYYFGCTGTRPTPTVF